MSTAQEYWNQLTDQMAPAPEKPPLAAFSGDDAAQIASAMFDDNADATALFDQMIAVGRRGRPYAAENREKSIQERFRLPESWIRYVQHATQREGYSNKSEYFRSLVLKDAKEHNEEKQLQSV